MGLDDLVDSTKDEADKEKVNNLADELGIEDREDLENLDGRIGRLFEHIILLDGKVERMEEEVSQVKRLLGELIEKEKEENEDESGNTTTADDWLDS